jgi:hypothetical protein
MFLALSIHGLSVPYWENLFKLLRYILRGSIQADINFIALQLTSPKGLFCRSIDARTIHDLQIMGGSVLKQEFFIAIIR